MKKDVKKHQYELLLLFVFLLVTAISVCGCKKKKGEEDLLSVVNLNETLPSNTPIPAVTLEPEPDVSREGMVKSLLTGEWISIEEAEARPYAVVFNNINAASPQSGIGDADILYEALVESGITRLMGIYGKIDAGSAAAKRMGSIRSARHYFVSFASEYDAIFIHFGETSYAVKKMKKLNTDHLTGTNGYGVNSFYRDNTIKAPHNAFASLDGILKGIEKGNFRTELKEGQEGRFHFYEEDTTPVSEQKAEKIVLPFSSGMQPYFVYDTEKKCYIRYQFKKEHIDYNTGEALTFKNIILQFVKEWDIDKNGYQTMDLEDATGEGYYIANGKAVPITWKKNESTYFMRYYDMEGKELTINTGKTYIAVFPDHRLEKITIE